jgi:F-type H+-transporting ATPase subunit alpha
VFEGYLDKIDIKKIGRFEDEFLRDLSQQKPQILETLATEKTLNKDLENSLSEFLKEFVKSFA